MKLNDGVKKLWVAALESGKFKQGYKRMSNSHNGEFCPLGVLCELHRLLSPEGGEWRDDIYFTNGHELGFSHILPPYVLNWAFSDIEVPEYSSASPNSVPVSNDATIVFYNDQEQKTFIEIAKIIKEKL